MSKYIELAKKIYELTKRGVGGEKENAELQLQKLMEKYNITMEDLEEEEINAFSFKYAWDFYLSEKLLFQIMYTVLPVENRERYEGDTRYSIKIYCTAQQKLEIEMLYNFYLEKLKEDLQLFYQAFIHKNDLFPKGTPVKETEYTPEEIDRISKIRQIMDGIDEHIYYKQIENKGSEVKENGN